MKLPQPAGPIPDRLVIVEAGQLGHALRQGRLAARLSACTLAARLELTRQTVCYRETGVITLDVIDDFIEHAASVGYRVVLERITPTAETRSPRVPGIDDREAG